jgi:hypothetical protein
MTIYDPARTITAETRTQLTANLLDLGTQELHDFSDLAGPAGQANRLLRWMLAIAVLLTLGHLAWRPGVPDVQALPAFSESHVAQR